MIKVYGRITSANVQPVMWCLNELGLAHERIDVGGPFGGNDTADFLAMNPLGLIPVLEDEGQTLSEMTTILRYLLRKYGDHPSDPMAAAQVERWADMSRLHIYHPLVPVIFHQQVRVTVADRDNAAIARAATELSKTMAIAESLIKGPFIGGATPNLIDYHIGTLLYRYYGLDFDRPDLAGLRTYYDMLCERPAYRDNVMIDFSAMKIPGA